MSIKATRTQVELGKGSGAYTTSDSRLTYPGITSCQKSLFRCIQILRLNYNIDINDGLRNEI